MAAIIRDLLYALSGDSLTYMYGDISVGSFVCLSILRLLDSDSPEMVSKSYIMRLLFITDPIPLQIIQEWVPFEYKDIHSKAVNELLKLHILEKHTNQNNISFILNQNFRKSLVDALCNPMEPWDNFEISSKTNDESIVVTKELIEQNSITLWEKVLYFFVGAGDISIADTVRIFLTRTNLMTSVSNNQKQLSITVKGYEYILKDQSEQAWVFINEAIKLVPEEKEKEQIISLVFMLSYCTFGTGYPISALTSLQKQLLFELSQLGIIFISSLQSQYFYPSKLAISLLSGHHHQNKDGHIINLSRRLLSEKHISIIVETNFQVIAYVTSELYLAILKIFIDVTVRLPNAVLGQITRAKSKEAFSRGITTTQIIHFLTMHAHIRVKNKENIIPVNVKAQLLLWEKEQERLISKESVLFDFSNDRYLESTRFSELYKCAKDVKDAVLWVDEKQCRLAISQDRFSAFQQLAASRGLSSMLL